MYDADAIEAINFEQLATVTDRLLLRGERISKRRPSTNRLAYLARPIEPALDRTLVVRTHRRSFAGAALAVSAFVCAFAASFVTLV